MGGPPTRVTGPSRVQSGLSDGKASDRRTRSLFVPPSSPQVRESITHPCYRRGAPTACTPTGSAAEEALRARGQLGGSARYNPRTQREACTFV